MVDEALPVLPPDENPSWLARNRKIVILGGVAGVLAIAAVATYLIPRLRSTATNTNTTANITTDTGTTANPTNNAAANSSTRPTFQRSTIANVSTVPPPAYQPPTKEQLKQAIDQLRIANTSSP